MKKLNYISLTLVALTAWLFGGCIKDDIPYPRIQANFLSIEVEGVTAGPVIDSLNRTVTLTFGEEANIYNVDITAYTLTPKAYIVDDTITGGIDLSAPRTVTLRLYQDYDWQLIANRPIERYMTVASQIGSTEIDAVGHRVLLSVNAKADISDLEVLTMKLGPTGSTTTPELVGTKVDFTKPVEVTVDDYGHLTTWTIYVQTTVAAVTTVAVDAWSQVAWVYGEAEEGRTNGVEYRLTGDQQWTRIPATDITFTGGSFCGCIKHLSAETSYEARAYSNDDTGETIAFTTQGMRQLPNSSLDEWWLDKKVWNPWPEGGEQYWDTGNKGAATLGQSNSVPTEDTSTGTGWAAKLETRFVGIGMLGKLAAGNLFVGKYVRTDGTNGILSFGREFDLRPTKVRGWYKYTAANITHTSAGFEDLKGTPDTGIIWCALIDQDEPFEIRTNPNNRQLFDPEGSYVVGYGKIENSQNISEWIPFEFEIKYTSTSRVPKYILLTASASSLGDYFTGGAGATLYLDDLELVYDY